MTNNDIKRIQSLEMGKFRMEYNQFFIEGKRLVQSVLGLSAKIDSVYFTDPFRIENMEMVDSVQNSDISFEQIPTKQFSKISFTQSPSGIGAVCRLPDQGKADLNQNKWLYLDKVSDPGNMGTLLRSAAWFNFTQVALSPDCVDPFNPKVVRAGMGAHFGLSIHTDINLDIFSDSHTLVGANHRGDSLDDFTTPDRFILVLGSEAHGLSDDILRIIDQTISIEKTGFGESLNVGVAGAILMHKLSFINR